MTRRVGIVCAVVAALGAAACGSDGPTSPSPSCSLNGTWSGAIADGSAGQGRLELTLSETPLAQGLTLLSGTWRVTFAQGSRDGTGVITGGITTSGITLNLDRAVRPSCSPAFLPNALHADGFVLDLTLASNRLSGRSTYYTCSDAFEGTVDLAR